MTQVEKLQKNKRTISLPIVILHLSLLFILFLLLIPADIISSGILGAVLSKVRIVGSFAPTFDHDIANYTVNQTDPFYLDVNCSDIDPLDSITYGDNFSGFDINSSTGLIDIDGFSQSFVGNHSINIYCADLYGFNTSKNFTFEILEVNEAPQMSSIGNQLLVSGEQFTLDVSAFDPENDSLTFAAVTSLFTINPITGLINFTPTNSQVSNHTVNITVFDGQLYDHEVVLFTILQGPFCGDGSCGNGESCVTCQTDCGVCPSLPGGESNETVETNATGEGGTSSSGGGDITSIPPQAQAPFYRCDEKWECNPWSVCTLQGSHTRKCKDLNQCGTFVKRPEEVEECEYLPTCEDGIQNGGETDIDCGGPCKPCPIENCFDGAQNNDEEGIDCGGSCEKKCEEARQAKVPAIEIPGLIELPRKFPWLFLLLVALLLLIALISDQIYMRKILRHKLDEYSRKRREYAPWRRRLYKAMINTIVISLITSAYLYYFSNNYQGMLKYLWVLLCIIAFVPSVVSVVIQKYRYKEYEKLRKEQRFKQTHHNELLHFIKLENDVLANMEKQNNKEIYEQTKNHAFDSTPSLYATFSGCYAVCTNIIKKRKERGILIEMGTQTFNSIMVLLSNKALRSYAKEYPEFYSLRSILSTLEENPHADVSDKEQELLDEIEEISKPHVKTVILSDPRLVDTYNALVDLYEEYRKKQASVQAIDKELYELERSFTDKIKELTKKSEDMQAISKNNILAGLYNNAVRLFNHYSRKQQLKKALESL